MNNRTYNNYAWQFKANAFTKALLLARCYEQGYLPSADTAKVQPDWVDHPERIKEASGQWSYLSNPYEFSRSELFTDAKLLSYLGWNISVSEDSAYNARTRTYEVKFTRASEALRKNQADQIALSIPKLEAEDKRLRKQNDADWNEQRKAALDLGFAKLAIKALLCK